MTMVFGLVLFTFCPKDVRYRVTDSPETKKCLFRRSLNLQESVIFEVTFMWQERFMVSFFRNSHAVSQELAGVWSHPKLTSMVRVHDLGVRQPRTWRPAALSILVARCLDGCSIAGKYGPKSGCICWVMWQTD